MRHLYRPIVCLALGAVITVAVAWAVAVAHDEARVFRAPRLSAATWLGDLYWSASVSSTPGHTRVASVWRFGIHDPTFVYPKLIATDVLPAWAVVNHEYIEALVKSESRDTGLAWSSHELAFGWPVRALAGRTIIKLDGGHTDQGRVHSAIWIDSKPPRNSFAQRMLPLRPLWRGLLIDTLIYGSVLWCLLVLHGHIRRTVRRRRGRCPACGYPSSGAGVCSECGESHETTENPARHVQRVATRIASARSGLRRCT